MCRFHKSQKTDYVHEHVNVDVNVLVDVDGVMFLLSDITGTLTVQRLFLSIAYIS